MSTEPNKQPREQASTVETGETAAALADAALSKEPEFGELEAKLKQLSPEEAEIFVRMLELALKKRRVMLVGYLAALCMVLFGTAWAIYMFANRSHGEFIGWVFLLPPTMAGVSLWACGRLVKAIKR